MVVALPLVVLMHRNVAPKPVATTCVEVHVGALLAPAPVDPRPTGLANVDRRCEGLPPPWWRRC